MNLPRNPPAPSVARTPAGPHPRDASRLWAITSYFNPIGYARRRANYAEFRRRLTVPLITVELAYDGRFDLPDDAAEILIRIPGKDVIWQKERLLNLALRALPAHCDRIAWLDCDIVFEDPDWGARSCEALERFELIQPFDRVYESPPDAGPDWRPGGDEPATRSAAQRPRMSFGYAFSVDPAAATELMQSESRLVSNCTSGMAWAARRELIEPAGFYDACVGGSGDRAIWGALLGRPDLAIRRIVMNPTWTDHYLAWAAGLKKVPPSAFGYVRGTITHLWHGDLKNRQYAQRHRDFARFDFDPVRDIAIDENGCWRWNSPKPSMHAQLARYFEQRREDAQPADRTPPDAVSALDDPWLDGLPPAQRAIRARCILPGAHWHYRDTLKPLLTIDRCVERIAAESPGRLAIRTATVDLTYGELDRRANRVAQALLRTPLPDATALALLLPMGADEIVAMLGILKAGIPFVSLSPRGAPARNRSIVDRIGVSMIVTDSAHAALARDCVGDDGRLLRVDALPAAADDPPTTAAVGLDTVGRIVMTSGSSGEPKGVVHTHRSTLAGAIARNNAIHLSADDGLLVVTPSFTELWRPLLSGATLYLFDLVADPVAVLARWATTERITVFRSAPSVLREVIALLAGKPASPPADPGVRGGAGAGDALIPALRVIELMGEPVAGDLVRLYQRHFGPACVMINYLGAKEVLDYRLLYIDQRTVPETDFVAAGHPLEHAEIDLVGDDGAPVRPGEPGEIRVRSPSMAAGYWRRPDLTAERFRSATAPGGRRTYLTGDRGVLLADGSLQYLGRTDSMVKILGNQVHLDAVEQRIRELDGVVDAAVLVAAGDAGQPRLVACVAVTDRTVASPLSIRRELGRSMPPYMIPTRIEMLPAMPRTPMGKIDRTRLRELFVAGMPGPETATPPAPATLPDTAIEREVLAIWDEVLTVRPAGVDDNFFDLGGDSVSLQRVLVRIHQRCGVAIPIAAFFDGPTVKALARQVEQARRRGAGPA